MRELDEAESGGVNKPNPFSKETSFQLMDDIMATMAWDKHEDELIFKVEMPTDTQLSFIFGADTTKKCDMVIFDSSMGNPHVNDCTYDARALEGMTVRHDSHQDWFVEVGDYGSRYNKLFMARRKLDTGDSDDFAI